MNYINEYENLTLSEKKVLKYILDNQEKIPYMSISDITKDIFVSKTVVINLSQKLGYDGFRELKFHINNELKRKIDIKDTESKLDIKNKLKNLIQKTLMLIEDEKMEKITDLIKKSRSVFIVARGTSKAAGYYLEHLLLTKGIKCIFIKDYNISEVFPTFLTEEDLVIFISLSGNTKKIIDTALKSSMKHVKMISITSFTENQLADIADYNLYFYSENSDTKENDTISRIGVFLLIDVITNKI